MKDKILDEEFVNDSNEKKQSLTEYFADNFLLYWMITTVLSLVICAIGEHQFGWNMSSISNWHVIFVDVLFALCACFGQFVSMRLID